MAYYLNLVSPETYEMFTNSDRSVAGFGMHHRSVASRIHPGDVFVCYMTRLSRWVGILDVKSDAYDDNTPRYGEFSDTYVVRFKVAPRIWLPPEKAIPIFEDVLWKHLSFTHDQVRGSSTWTGKIRGSLARFDDADGRLIEASLADQQLPSARSFPLSADDARKMVTHRVRRADKDVTVTVPLSSDEDESLANAGAESEAPGARESIGIQALLADIGFKMGMSVWIPRNDRGRVQRERTGSEPLLDRLPLNYDDATLKTIEQIDVIWLKNRSMKRAFEVEHTTSIYSGILRMADLLALQPNMDIKLHLVAPAERREKVFQELGRPVFSFLDRGPLTESCTYLSYESVREIAALPHLAHTSESILDEYQEGENE